VSGADVSAAARGILLPRRNRRVVLDERLAEQRRGGRDRVLVAGLAEATLAVLHEPLDALEVGRLVGIERVEAYGGRDVR